MSERPYTNEPGFEVARSEKDVQDLSDIIAHETLRVACLGNVKVRPGEAKGAGAGAGADAAGEAGPAAAGAGAGGSAAAAPAATGPAARAAAAAALASMLPDDLLAAARDSFREQRDVLLARCDEFGARLDGKKFVDPFGEQRWVPLCHAHDAMRRGVRLRTADPCRSAPSVLFPRYHSPQRRVCLPRDPAGAGRGGGGD
jgi:hypothetical protein